MTGSDLEARLAEIKQAYQAELPNKVSDLKAVWNGVEAEHWGADRLQELHRLIHGLTGSGATFGFEHLSFRAHRRGKPFTFAMIDIDWFKTVNDTYGHPVSD